MHWEYSYSRPAKLVEENFLVALYREGSWKPKKKYYTTGKQSKYASQMCTHHHVCCINAGFPKVSIVFGKNILCQQDTNEIQVVC